MFDIGFSELVIIAVVGLLVIGPERLPGAIRTGSAWLSRIKRGFNDIKNEVQQELHNDAVMQDLKNAAGTITEQAGKLDSDIRAAASELQQSEPSSDSSKPPGTQSEHPDSAADKANE